MWFLILTFSATWKALSRAEMLCLYLRLRLWRKSCMPLTFGQSACFVPRELVLRSTCPRKSIWELSGRSFHLGNLSPGAPNGATSGTGFWFRCHLVWQAIGRFRRNSPKQPLRYAGEQVKWLNSKLIKLCSWSHALSLFVDRTVEWFLQSKDGIAAIILRLLNLDALLKLEACCLLVEDFSATSSSPLNFSHLGHTHTHTHTRCVHFSHTHTNTQTHTHIRIYIYIYRDILEGNNPRLSLLGSYVVTFVPFYWLSLGSFVHTQVAQVSDLMTLSRSLGLDPPSCRRSNTSHKTLAVIVSKNCRMPSFVKWKGRIMRHYVGWFLPSRLLGCNAWELPWIFNCAYVFLIARPQIQ